MTRNTKIHYFRFPKDTGLCNRWVEFCKKAVDLKNGRICSVHFEESAFTNTYKMRMAMGFTVAHNDYLKDDAVPTQLPPVLSTSCPNIEPPSLIESTSQVESLACTEVNPCANIEPPSPIESTSQKESSPCTEVDPKITEANDIVKMKIEISILHKKIKAQGLEIDHLNDILKKFFTPGQIKCMKSGKRFVQWSSEDISSAISLRSISPKAYRYLRTIREYPLPSLSTLQQWVSKINFQPGVLADVLMIIKYKACSMTEKERICVIAFDEVYVSNKMAVDTHLQKVVGPHRTAQTVMARGLLSNWKQVVYYDFDQPMTKQVLLELITQLHLANLIVVAVVSDLGPSNLSLKRELNIGYEEHQTCSFPHPQDDNLKVFFFNDSPHIIKLVRNNLFDSGLKREDQIASKDCIRKLLDIQSSEIKLTPKLTPFHLDVAGHHRQNVTLAAQVLSHTVAQALIWCGEKGLMGEVQWQYTANIIKLMNDWFDVFNTRTKFSKQSHAFGINIEEQVALLNKVDEEMKNIKVGKRTALLPFQRAILLNNKSLTNVYDCLKIKYDIEYILTYRLNQDVLENFFSYIRAAGARNEHPTALDYQHRIRWYVMGKHSSAAFTTYANTERDEEDSLISVDHAEKFLTDFIKDFDTEPPIQEVNEEENIISTFSSFEELDNPQDYLHLLGQFEEFSEENEIVGANDIVDEGLIYIAGYVAFKCKKKYVLYEDREAITNNETFSWTHSLSKGQL